MNKSESSYLRRKIVKLIGDSVYHAISLKETLVEEGDALNNQDMDALNAALKHKADIIEKLRAIEEERNQLCESRGFSAGADQMKAVIERCDKESIIDCCWSHLMELATECNSLNMKNGAVIRTRTQQIGSVLAVLRGDEQAAATYSSGGNQAQVTHLRAIAKA